jgi:eukaryotic-like serine/threonine-protein kinase
LSQPTEFHQIDALFDRALDLTDEEQAAFLAQTCAHDPELRNQVQRLLDAKRRAGAFLESPAIELAAPLLDSFLLVEANPGQNFARLGPFRIVRELGTGGMGAVFLGERDDGLFQQRVALKLVQQRAGATDLIQRFLEERRILALLEHPGIARLVDGGISADGQPYFAMEFVEGEAIDRYCDGRQLGIDQRISLFLPVCEAVQYAHQHLVVHRDLKPSNILVSADGQVKLLDFGIAKLLDPLAATNDDPLTRTGVLPMTPEYAAPEQIRGEPISTATDIYALGVLLYALLTGRRPYEVRGRSPAELERIVCDVEPPRPSARFEGTGAEDDQTERAHARGAQPQRVRRRLRGDLDLIVMKALRKDPARRYATVSALQEDLHRFLTGRPVHARPDSAGYRIRKFVRRNRTSVAAACVTIAALIGATAISASQMREAERQRDVAVQDAKRKQAMSEVQTVLASDSRGPGGRSLSPVERVELAEQVLTRRFGSEPWLVAEVMTDLANTLYETGDRTAQRRVLARAGGIARAAGLPPQLALTNCIRAYSFAFDDQFDSARIEMTEARSALARPGTRSAVVDAICLDAEAQLLVAENRPDSGVALLRRALALAENGAEPVRMQMLNDLATALRSIGETREASRYYQQNLNELESAGYVGTDAVPNMVSFVTSALSELGELAQVDSLVWATIMRDESIYGAGSAGSTLTFLYGQAKLRLGENETAEVWLTRAMRDTTQGAGGLAAWLPPAIAQLRLEQRRLADARRAISELPSGTLTRRANAAWLGAWLRRSEGDTLGAQIELETALRGLVGNQPKPPAALAVALVNAAEWRLSSGPPLVADSLARLAVAAAAVDSLALQRSAYVGRAELVRARALLRIGQRNAAHQAAERALIALTNGYGPTNPRPREARALRDSILR